MYALILYAGETLWFDLELISKLMKSCQEIFPVVEYAYTTIPTYIGGQIGFLLNSKNSETNFRVSCFLFRILYSQSTLWNEVSL